jgi:ferrous iron transport protein B
MGIRQDNYPATVSVFTGVFAKEAIVGSLDSLYGQLAREEIPPEPDTPFEFWGNIRDAFASIPANLANLGNQLLDPLGVGVGDLENTEIAAESQGVASQTFGQMVNRFDGKIGAFAYLLFVLLYFPCLAATAAIYRETGTRWTVFAGVWTTGLAYWVATVFYQAATFARHPAFSTVWIFGAIALLAGTILGMRRMGRLI